MGSSHLNLSFRSGKMRVFICFLVAFHICGGVKQGGGGPGGNGGGPGGNGGGNGGSGYGGGNGGSGYGGGNGGNGYGGGNGGSGYGGGNGGNGGGPGGNGGYGGYGYGCCALKAVEMGENKLEMFALMDAYPYYQMPEFCNSMCVYVKMSELKPLVEQYNNATENMNMRLDDSGMMEEMLGPDKWTMMQVQIKAQGLQKYCFMDSEDAQAMCAEPDMYNLQMMLSGMGDKDDMGDKEDWTTKIYQK